MRESGTVSIAEVRRAWAARDPDVVELILSIANSPDPEPERPDAGQGIYSLARFRAEMLGTEYLSMGPDERMTWRQSRMERLEAAEGDDIQLPPRFSLSEILLEIWQSEEAFSRAILLQILGRIRLRWGAWRAVKRIFKEAEEAQDLQTWGLLAARFDVAFTQDDPMQDITRRTLGYLVRRAWRHLRHIAVELPAMYPDAVVAVLRHYPQYFYTWQKTWIANHVFFHQTGKYNRRRFKMWYWPDDLLSDRAYPDLWRRSPRPLFNLLEEAEAANVIGFATASLTSEFRTQLRDVEPQWVRRLIARQQAEVHDFVIWVLNNVPRFEQSAFREMGLHQPVLALLDSPSDDARGWVAKYVRAHARDLPLARVLALVNNSHQSVRKLARDLIRERDPRRDIGLEGWGKLLGTDHGHEMAVEAITQHFGASELTPEWFKVRFMQENHRLHTFLADHLGRVHKIEKLGRDFFVALITDEAPGQTQQYALKQLRNFELTSLEPDLLRKWLVWHATDRSVVAWINEDLVSVEKLGVTFLKAVAYHPDRESSPWFSELAEAHRWARPLDLSQLVAEEVRAWLADVRRFSPEELGFDWFFELVQRPEPEYFQFASDYMVKSFLPADFAARGAGGSDGASDSGATDTPGDEATISLEGASFVFTGKLKTMTRKEAQNKVLEAGGKAGKSVNASLDYLVIGDEGSPFYGEGRKGSKQVKAEKLIEGGAELKVISETAFLQMLAGDVREFDESEVLAGCEQLWSYVTRAPESPLGQFARRYLRMHHPDISLAETDRPVDPGAEIPDSFLTFERVSELLKDDRQTLRGLGLELSRWELARWSPSLESLMPLAESPHKRVRELVRDALLSPAGPEHARYRLDPSLLDADPVYRLCESTVPAARQLGLALIEAHDHLAVPQELFRMTESPDRAVRAFVVRKLWSLYRERGITRDWNPWVEPEKPEEKADEPSTSERQGAPVRPDSLPASFEPMRDFLRRALFTIPPARLPARPDGALKPLPARRAKLALVEVYRDIALDDQDFAQTVTPVLQEFLGSRGQTERDACLVAITRIYDRYPELQETR